MFVHRQDNSTRYSLSFSADGRTLTWVTVVGEKIEFCDATTGRPDQRWQTPPFQGFIAVAFAPDGQTLAVGTQHGVILWDLAKAKTRRELTGGNAGGLQFSANGRRLASRCGRWHYPQVLQVLEVATGPPLPPRGTPAGHRGEVNVVAFSPDGRSLASASSTDNSVRLWDVAERRLIHIWRSSVHNHHHLAFSPSGDRLFSGGGRHDIRAWNTITGREQASLSLHEPGKDKQAWWAVNNMRLSADGQTLAAVCFESPDKPGVLTSVALWDVASGKRLLRRREHFNYLPTTFWPGEISPDAKTWAILDGKLKDVATGAERRALTAGLWIGDPYAFSADGLLVAGALSQPFEIKEPLQRRPGGPIEAAQVWETATGQPLARLKTGHIGYMTFAPDGRSLLTADDKAIRLWDAITGKVLWQQPAHAAYRDSKRGSFVSSLAVSPDGRTVATGLIDSTILLWELPPSHRPPPAAPLSAEQLEGLWADLAKPDAVKAFAAVDALAAQPGLSLPLLCQRLKPATVPADRIRRLISDLDSDQFTRREAATKELRALGELAEPGLRKALAKPSSLEVRRRIEQLLPIPPRELSSEELRGLRALRVLTQADTPEARRVLESLAQGAPEARLTQEAKAALERLNNRPAASR